MDLSDPVQCQLKAQKLVDETDEPIDIFVNNGGTSMRDEFKDLTLEMCERMMNVNFLSGVAICKALVPAM
jgi:short-subunit dehydrogenase